MNAISGLGARGRITVRAVVEILVIVACLLVNALLAGTEMAFVTAARPPLRERARQGDARAARLLVLRDNPERALSVIQVGITLVGALAAAVGGAGAQESIHPLLQAHFGLGDTAAEILAVVLVVAPITFLGVVFGELVPKALALRSPVAVALRAAPWLIGLERALSPLVTVLERSTKLVLWVSVRSGAPGAAPSKEGPPSDAAPDLDSLSRETREYVLNLVELERKRISTIYLPWAQVIRVEQGRPLEEIESVALSCGHTRLPVVAGDEVVGMINTKELLALRAHGVSDWRPIIRNIVRADESTPLLGALRLMQAERSHLSLVLRRGSPIGIVTLEDILEEVVGEIFDEDDDGRVRRLLASGAALRSGRRPV